MMNALAITGAIVCALTISTVRPASAGVPEVIAGLSYDSKTHQYYYTSSNKRHYVDAGTAAYYRSHGGRRTDRGYYHHQPLFLHRRHPSK